MDEMIAELRGLLERANARLARHRTEARYDIVDRLPALLDALTTSYEREKLLVAKVLASRERERELEEQARFLCDRLDELDFSRGRLGLENDYHGHVMPGLRRLQSTLARNALSSKDQDQKGSGE